MFPAPVGKGRFGAIMGIFVLLSSPSVVAQSSVEMESVVVLDEIDLGLEWATDTPDGKTDLPKGAESAIID